MPNNQIPITPLVARFLLLSIVTLSDFGCALSTHQKTCAPNCSDTTIADSVRDRLFDDAGIPDTYITVSTKNGVVYLHGSVATSVERDAAVAIASKVPGVVNVVDSLEINGAE